MIGSLSLLLGSKRSPFKIEGMLCNLINLWIIQKQGGCCITYIYNENDIFNKHLRSN